MPDDPVDLVFPGDPFVYPVIEQEPVRSNYTGKMLRRLHVGVRARDDELNDQLEAALTGTGTESAVVSDRSGGKWQVGDRSYSYQEGRTPGVHTVDLAEQEELHLEQVEFEGLSLTPDRWSLAPRGEGSVLTFLTTMDADTHQRFERALEYRQSDADAEIYFPVKWAGISDDPVSMRFARCVWECLDGGGARHSVILVSEEGDDADGVNLFEPEMTRLRQQSAMLRTRLDALIGELHRAGVLDDEGAARLGQEIIDVPFSSKREFDRVGDIEFFFR